MTRAFAISCFLIVLYCPAGFVRAATFDGNTQADRLFCSVIFARLLDGAGVPVDSAAANAIGEMKDVPEDLRKLVSRAVAAGLFEAPRRGRFHSNSRINRSQLAVIGARVMRLTGIKVDTGKRRRIFGPVEAFLDPSCSCLDVPFEYLDHVSRSVKAGLFHTRHRCFYGRRVINRYYLAGVLSGLMKILKIKAGGDVKRPVDVGESRWRFFDMAPLLASGVMKTKNGKFNGKGHIKRYELAGILFRFISLIDKKKIPRANDIIVKDVERPGDFADLVDELVARGLMNTLDGAFLGNRLVNRYQLALFTGRMLGASADERLPLLTIGPGGGKLKKRLPLDVRPAHYCYGAVLDLVTEGFIELDKGRFRGIRIITRYDVADLAARLAARLKLEKSANCPAFVDLAGDYAGKVALCFETGLLKLSDLAATKP